MFGHTKAEVEILRREKRMLTDELQKERDENDALRSKLQNIIVSAVQDPVPEGVILSGSGKIERAECRDGIVTLLIDNPTMGERFRAEVATYVLNTQNFDFFKPVSLEVTVKQ